MAALRKKIAKSIFILLCFSLLFILCYIPPVYAVSYVSVVSVTTNSVTVKVTPPYPSTSYNQYAFYIGGDYETYKGQGASNQYTYTGLSAGTTYTFSAKAWYLGGSRGAAGWYNYGSVTTSTTALDTTGPSLVISSPVVASDTVKISSVKNRWILEDKLSWKIVNGALGAFLIVNVYFLGLLLYQVAQKSRQFAETGKMRSLLNYIFVLGCLGAGAYLLPMTVFDLENWQHLRQAAPSEFFITMLMVGVNIAVFALYAYLVQNSRKENDRQLFLLSVLSIFSGISYSMIMFIINWVIGGTERNAYAGYYFVLTLICYVSGMKTVRGQLTTVTNGYVFELRKKLVDKISKTPFYKLEQLGGEEIYSSLNNDTEVISNVIGIVTLGVTCIVSMVCVFAYLTILDSAAVMVSVITIAIGVSIMLVMNKVAIKSFEASRRSQNTFYKFIGDLMKGFKELSLNVEKRRAFQRDMESCITHYKDRKTHAELVSTNIYFIGELLAIGILGSVVFIFPLFFPSTRDAVLRDFVFLFLYLKGPIDNVLNMIPRISQAKVSWDNVKRTYKKLEEMGEVLEHVEPVITEGFESLTLQGVDFEYQQTGGRHFAVGPFDMTFNKGEVTFITGGNGSGKSTLLKLITGLYKASSGDLLVNGKTVSNRGVGEYMTTVFGDFHLFSKIYGVDCLQHRERIKKYIKILQLEDKVSIDEGAFTTTNLSTGQRKRLALLISYLEDKPIFIFDEWAADQDPEYRAFFYNELLPELKARGKCIIAVTHDDQYFDLSDQTIKMEMGKVVQCKKTVQVKRIRTV